MLARHVPARPGAARSGRNATECLFAQVAGGGEAVPPFEGWQLTQDGVQDYGYATDNAGWKTTARAIVKWSPCSTKIATQQQDERDVGEWYMVETRVGHPRLHKWKVQEPRG